MNIKKKIEKRINTIVQITKEYPKEVKVTKEEWEQLEKKDKFLNVKLIVK